MVPWELQNHGVEAKLGIAILCQAGEHSRTQTRGALSPSISYRPTEENLRGPPTLGSVVNGVL